MRFTIGWGNSGVIRMFHGTVTADDIRHSVEQVRTDSRFATLVYRINDFDAVTKVDGLTATLAHAALRTIGDSKVNIKILVAIVATDPDVRALAELYSSPSYRQSYSIGLPKPGHGSKQVVKGILAR